MTEQELALFRAYKELRFFLGRFNDPTAFKHLESLYQAADKDAKENKCRCAKLQLTECRSYWSEPFSFTRLTRNDRAVLSPVIFNNCPECGRKLTDDEKRRI